MDTHTTIIAILVQRLGGKVSISMRDIQNGRALTLVQGPPSTGRVDLEVIEPDAPLQVQVIDITPGAPPVTFHGVLEDRR